MDDLERSVEEELDREEASGEDTEVVQPPAPAGDRRWTDEEKAQVVRECCWPGVKVGEVAQRHGLSVSQVSAWRKLAHRGRLTPPGSGATGSLAEAGAERSQAGGKAGAAAPGSGAAFAELEVVEETTAVGSVSIEARGVTVRLEGAIGAVRIAEIASALRGLR